MDINGFRKAQERGENIVIEFKESKGGICPDTYDTVCSFLNRFGGDLYLGVHDNGEVCGIPPKAVTGMIKNFISTIGNPENISPTVYLDPVEMVVGGKHIIHIHIPQSSEVHSHKKTVYDRVGDSDVKVTATGQIAQMYIRKQKIFTEKKVYPYVKDEDLRLDMLPKIRQMALIRSKDHPWMKLSDSELLQSAGLIGVDAETEKTGYNLAAVLLLGRDHVIKDICPTYRTDALLRKVNLDRYDDRLIIETNLIDSYELLMGFAKKHLWDKFHLEGDTRMSLRDTIAREVISNTLIHREFTAAHYARFVIEKDKMYTENANRAVHGLAITPQNLEPNPKNPKIASFFRNINYADELGSGVKNLFAYSRLYSGADPELLDGDVFRTTVPLDDSYSFDAETRKAQNKAQTKPEKKKALIQTLILERLRKNPNMTQKDIVTASGYSRSAVQEAFAALQKSGLLRREGSKMNGFWVVKESKPQ
ncbi:MAG: putative DNA binding domain-containing protein [Peptococcaceae bacterium]|nr:putative DNA binding domain-containing protein [Peptococcaceae bacterium]